MFKNPIWLFIMIMAAIILYLPSFFQIQDLKATNDEYKIQIARLKLRNAKLVEEQRLLEDDPEYLEKVAREKMHLLRDGEVMYHIEEE